MIKILFVCHGNICRSPMAEYIFKKLIQEQGLLNQFKVNSAATSKEEIDHDIYPPAKRCLSKHGNISNPWYSGDFETAYNEIEAGCRALLKEL